MAECATLDITAANIDGQAVASLGVPAYAFFSGPKLKRRVAAGMKAAGLTKGERAAFNLAIMAAQGGGSLNLSAKPRHPRCAKGSVYVQSAVTDAIPFRLEVLD